MNQDKAALLRSLPPVERLLSLLAAMPPAEFFREKPLGNNGPAPKHAGRVPKSVLLGACRDAVEEFRKLIISGQDVPGGREGMEGAVSALALEKARKALAPSLVPVVNGTGVVVHTNLGRSILAEKALAHALSVSCGYSNLEYELADGGRGSRFVHVEGLLKELTGAEAAFVVNNNAAAVLLCIDTLARGKKVIVSRGELVEIGGSFRIPEVMAKGGADLCEVGTTNRTHPADYERAIDADTGLLLKAHTSNFAVVGFTASVSLADLCRMGREHGIPVMEDLGSGSLLDLSAYGLSREPTVGDSVAAGADLVTFSGDKMLGGPQAGIIVGKKDVVARCKKNPLARALRIDKLTLAALESTLSLYRDPETAVALIPTLRLIAARPEELSRRARRLAGSLNRLTPGRILAKVVKTGSRVGGGALPLETLPSYGVEISVSGLSPNALERLMRAAATPVIGRIEDDSFLLDVRTIDDREISLVTGAISSFLFKQPSESI